MRQMVELVEKYIERFENLSEVLGYIVSFIYLFCYVIFPQTAWALGVLADIDKDGGA